MCPYHVTALADFQLPLLFLFLRHYRTIDQVGSIPGDLCQCQPRGPECRIAPDAVPANENGRQHNLFSMQDVPLVLYEWFKTNYGIREANLD